MLLPLQSSNGTPKLYGVPVDAKPVLEAEEQEQLETIN